ncbi:MAG TPA: serine hydrolase domain-containing protein [Vicinamibacterales bacterium]|nr:serine hydrolase domain-containing protein [Vicinamibacterales bacterium]
MPRVNRQRLYQLAAVIPVLACGALAGSQRSAAAVQAVTANRTQELERGINQELSRRGGVGATVAIVENGRPLLAKGFGRRSVESPAPVGEDTLFGIGSVTKQFTAAATLLLAEQGKLAVSDKVAKYYPGLTRANDITLLDLMNHVSGYPDYYPLDFVDRRMLAAIQPDELIRQYAGARLDFEPGTRWSYSNTGFVLLGRILEKASGQSLGSFLAKHIFEPVGMTHTVYEPKGDDRRVAPGYTSFALTALTRATREGDGWVGSAGAIYSTAADIARWDIALMDGRVLKPQSWDLMTTPRMLANGKSSNYGCGLSVGTREGVTVFTHGGAVSGFIARNTFIPQTRSAVVVVINDEDGPLANAIVERGLTAVMPARAAGLPVTTGPSAAREDRGEIPRVNGPEPGEKASALFKALQAGTLDRSGLGDEFSVFVTDAKARAASLALKPFGAPTGVNVRSVGERGGMEVSSVRLTFGSEALDGLMYRSPDGKVQEYLLFRP